MGNETKTPERDEWWLYNANHNCRLFIVGANSSGHMVGEDRDGNYEVFDGRGNMAVEFWHHEPRCTGFDWEEPPAIDPGDGWELLPVGTVLEEGDEYESGGDWNKTCYPGTKSIQGWTYRRRKPPAEVWVRYVVNTDESCRWYIKRISANSSQHVSSTEVEPPQRWGGYQDSLVESGSWIEVTEAEAIARVKPAEPVNPAMKALHELAITAGIDPLGLDPSDIAEKLIAKQQVTGCSGESPDSVPENRPAREVIREIVRLIADSSMTDEESADMAFQIGKQWLDDNPEDPPPFAKPFTDARSGMGIRNNNASVESPDDWVELNPEHVLRKDIDQVQYNSDCPWYPVDKSAGQRLAQPAPIDHERWFMWSDDRYPIAFVKRAGGKVFNLNVDGMFKTSDDWGASYEEKLINGEMIEVTEESAKAYLKRPRRKIIDPPAPQPKRTPVRLWHNPDSEDGMVFVSDVRVLAEDQEIKCGPSGFYVEEVE